MRHTLGADYWVVEEGLGGRTTVWDDPVEGEHKSGKRYLVPCLESHSPIDLVAIITAMSHSRFKTGFEFGFAGTGTVVEVLND